AKSRQLVISAARIVVGRGAGDFPDQAAIDELFDIVIERAGTELIAAVGLARDFLHDGIAVALFAGDRGEDVKGRRRKREEGCDRVFHFNSRSPLYRTPS